MQNNAGIEKKKSVCRSFPVVIGNFRSDLVGSISRVLVDGSTYFKVFLVLPGPLYVASPKNLESTTVLTGW